MNCRLPDTLGFEWVIQTEWYWMKNGLFKKAKKRKSTCMLFKNCKKSIFDQERKNFLSLLPNKPILSLFWLSTTMMKGHYNLKLTVLLFLGSTIPCANYCKIPEQATVRRTHQSYRGAVYVGRDEEKWNQLQDEGRTREFAIVAEGRGGRMEELFHSRTEWEIWKGSVGKTGRNWFRVWFWNIDLEDNDSNSFYLIVWLYVITCCEPKGK